MPCLPAFSLSLSLSAKQPGQSDVTCQDDDDLENDFTRMLLKKHFKRRKNEMKSSFSLPNKNSIKLRSLVSEAFRKQQKKRI